MYVNMSKESENLTVSPAINVPEYSLSTKQTHGVAEGRDSLIEDAHIDSTPLVDLGNASTDGLGYEDVSLSYIQHVSLGEDGNMCMFDPTTGHWFLKDMLPGLISPPHHPKVMPMGEISTVIDSDNEMDIHGQGAQLPIVYKKYGGQKTHFKEVPQPTLNSPEQILQGLSSTNDIHLSPICSGQESANAFHLDQSYESLQKNLEVTQDFAVESESPLAANQYFSANLFLVSPAQSSLNSQTPIQTPNSDILSPEKMPMLLRLSSTYSMHPSSYCPGGGHANAFHLGQTYESQQQDLEVTGDFASESQLASHYSYINSSWTSPPQSTFNFQTPIQTSYSSIQLPKEMQKLPGSLSRCSMHPSSDSSGGGSANASHLGLTYESWQNNLEATRDFADEPELTATLYSNINSLLSSPPQSTLNLQPLIQTPNHYISFPEEMQKHPVSSACSMHSSSDSCGEQLCQTYESWQKDIEKVHESSSKYCVRPSPDSFSAGGIISAFQFDQSCGSPQTKLDVIQDFASELPAAKQSSNIILSLVSPPQSTFNFQTSIQSPYSIQHPEEMQKLLGLSSTCSMHPSGGGGANAFHLGHAYEYWQNNLEVTHDFAVEPQLSAMQYSNIDILLASPPQSTLNLQPLIQTPNHCISFPEEMQKLPGSSSCSMYSSSDSCGEQLWKTYESWQKNIEVNIASELLTEEQYFNNSVLVSSPLSTLKFPSPRTTNFHVSPPEMMQKVQESSSKHCVHPSPDSFSAGGIISAFQFDQSYGSPQTKLDVIPDFASELPAAKWNSDIESSLESPPQSTLNFQTPIQTPHSYIQLPEEMQMLLGSSSICMHPSSDSFGERSALEATPDFATDSAVIESSLQRSSIATRYASEYRGTSYALDGSLQNYDPTISAVIENGSLQITSRGEMNISLRSYQ
ncbi:hypothetical protein SAY87_014432 [Trapa incisa]|uniref:Uncharacterized protein n=1 Tax=Trapa incisa TaxID=236973 RepID=A0AAN7JDC5_9MYRT|nr:hypothetical protein SAY87_014432 [Trapa incisa]